MDILNWETNTKQRITMQNLLNEFKELVGPFHAESGNIKRRTSWTKLCGLASKLALEVEAVVTHLNQEDGLVLCLAACSPGEKRNKNLIALFTQALEYKPTDKFINLLSHLSSEEINNTLLPFIYEPGNKSSNAVYLAALLGIIIKAEVFSTFIATHQWSRADLINLSLLVIPEEKNHLIKLLEETIARCESVVEKTAYASFKYIIETNDSNTPIFPELTLTAPPTPVQLPSYVPAATAEPTPALEVGAKAQQPTFVKAPTLESTPKSSAAATASTASATLATPSPQALAPKKIVKPQVQAKDSIFANQIKVFQSPALKSTLKEHIDKYAMPISIGAGAIFIGFFIMLIINMSTDLDAPERISSAVPSSWIDASTNQKITKAYLAADVDYRMGELYLSRNYYEDALKLFEDALSRDKTHLLALIRVGNCHYYLKNYAKALDTFKRVLSQAPKAQFINLYIARIFKSQNQPKEAIKHYNLEMKLEIRVDIGLEFAHYLRSIGEHNKSMEVLHDLQQRFPEKPIVLTSNYDDSGETL